MFCSLLGSLLLFLESSMVVGWMVSDRFLWRLLSEVITWRRCLHSWIDEVDGLASLCTGLWRIAAYRGDRAYR
jgi:hypothetical protein